MGSVYAKIFLYIILFKIISIEPSGLGKGCVCVCVAKLLIIQMYVLFFLNIIIIIINLILRRK